MIEEAVSKPSDAERRVLLETLAHAFRDNPMNRAIHGANPQQRIRANRAGLRSLVLDTADFSVSRVIRHEDRVVGGFVAVAPGEYPLPPPSLWRQLGCWFHQGAHAMDRWGRVSEALREHHPTENHWYLEVLGVLPSMQGRGFGGRLLDAWIELAEQGADPQPLYLESDRDESIRFYRSRGFALRTESEIFGVRCACLGRGFPGVNADLCDSVRELRTNAEQNGVRSSHRQRAAGHSTIMKDVP